MRVSRRFNFRILGLSPLALGLLVTVLAANPAQAQQATPDDLEETDRVTELSQSHQFSPAVSEKDPFKPLITKPKPPEPDIRPPQEEQASRPVEIKQVIPPLSLKVTGICGNESERLAMIEFNQKSYVVFKEMTVDESFKVVDIFSDKVVVYSFKEQMRRTFPIGGGKE
ncbi:MAG: hypothetical protein BWY66_00725 [bacterium ADurb.Bin374]|nr:MAG: hypothetical protein BWY66_00725 [bacterium ADurb.Bin374]